MISLPSVVSGHEPGEFGEVGRHLSFALEDYVLTVVCKILFAL